MRGADVREVGTDRRAGRADGVAAVAALILKHAAPLGRRRASLPCVRARRRHEEERLHRNFTSAGGDQRVVEQTEYQRTRTLSW